MSAGNFTAIITRSLGYSSGHKATTSGQRVPVKMRVEALQVFPVQQVQHRLLNEDYSILEKNLENWGLGRLWNIKDGEIMVYSTG